MVIDCLIIIKPWLEKILSGEKDMEIGIGQTNF